jgi:hypothetical protein
MRTKAFVERLLRRWRRWIAPPHPLGLVFRRPPRPRQREVRVSVTHGVTANTVVDLRPRIELTLAAAAAPAERGATSPVVERTFREGRERLLLRRSTATAVERVATRVLSRGARIERSERSPAAPTPDGAAPRPLPPRPARLVVRREQPPTAPASSPPAAPHPALGPDAASMPPLSAGPVAAPVNVEELTDRVVAAIDRRIVIASERTGRA